MNKFFFTPILKTFATFVGGIPHIESGPEYLFKAILGWVRFSKGEICPSGLGKKNPSDFF